ncbi:erythronate-4-phosphate dehydrogenase [Escherichia coli]|nr:erythronate-4-phosphate dehydrogenase [Escherichia coli]
MLDVWEGEPELNVELLKKVDIGTPHIAGYTLEGKARGTTQVFELIASLLGMNSTLRWIHYCLRQSLVALRCMARSINRR